MPIYTKKGDAGDTGLLGGKRVGKDALRVETYGGIDELNAVLGLALAGGLPDALREKLERVQRELFTLGSQLATAPETPPRAGAPEVRADWTAALERAIDEADQELAPLKNFILPGGATAAAWLHLARTTCRRAERAIVALSHRENVDPRVLAYVNRLSDWLFTMARLANHRAKVPETTWTA